MDTKRDWTGVHENAKAGTAVSATVAVSQSLQLLTEAIDDLRKATEKQSKSSERLSNALNWWTAIIAFVAIIGLILTITKH